MQKIIQVVESHKYKLHDIYLPHFPPTKTGKIPNDPQAGLAGIITNATVIPGIYGWGSMGSHSDCLSGTGWDWSHYS